MSIWNAMKNYVAGQDGRMRILWKKDANSGSV